MSNTEDLERRVEALSAEVQELKKQVGELIERAPPTPADIKPHAGIQWGRIPADAEYRQAFCPACAAKNEWVPLGLKLRRPGEVTCMCPTGKHYPPLITPEDVTAAGGAPLEDSA